jgi:hypothetical protein
MSRRAMIAATALPFWIRPGLYSPRQFCVPMTKMGPVSLPMPSRSIEERIG